MKVCLETTSMFCSAEKVIELLIIQQNDKSMQIFVVYGVPYVMFCFSFGLFSHQNSCLILLCIYPYSLTLVAW